MIFDSEDIPWPFLAYEYPQSDHHRFANSPNIFFQFAIVSSDRPITHSRLAPIIQIPACIRPPSIRENLV